MVKKLHSHLESLVYSRRKMNNTLKRKKQQKGKKVCLKGTRQCQNIKQIHHVCPILGWVTTKIQFNSIQIAKSPCSSWIGPHQFPSVYSLRCSEKGERKVLWLFSRQVSTPGEAGPDCPRSPCSSCRPPGPGPPCMGG